MLRNLDKYDDNILRGFVLEVDLEYSKELEIKREILPDYQSKVADN